MNQSLSISWEAIPYNSAENCSVRITGDRILVDSTLHGKQDEQAFNLHYILQLNEKWETSLFTINGSINDRAFQLTAARSKNNRWRINDIPNNRFDNLIDIDISLSPLTNTLPISRLGIEKSEVKIPCYISIY